MKTILSICLIIATGFFVVGIINYYSASRMYMRDMENISSLTSEGIYHRLDSIFTKPINISLTMANDRFLIDFLAKEDVYLNENEDEYIKTMQEYLDAYKQKYNYDSVFLVSVKSGHYYNFNGLDRILTEDNPENQWFYSFLKDRCHYSLNVDTDKARQNEITVFVNCGILDDNGTIIGVVGVGLRIGYLQDLLQKYAQEFGVDTFLIDQDGLVEISADKTGYRTVNYFDISGYPELKDEILGEKEMPLHYRRNVGNRRIYVVAQYIPALNWHLIIEKDMKEFDVQMRRQFWDTMLVIIISVTAILFIIIYVIRRFEKRIIHLTDSLEDERQKAFRKATEHHFNDIYEINITKNRAVGEHLLQYFNSLGLSDDTPYDEGIQMIAQMQIKEEYREGYLTKFNSENVMKEYKSGNTRLQYDFQISLNKEEYCWFRIDAHIFHMKEDNSVHMLSYRQNIDDIKRKDTEAQTDGLTGLYNKVTTERLIRQALCKNDEGPYVFFIIDIDDFKQINDGYGHAFGDRAISEFAAIIKRSCRKGDTLGRIGGDEFVIFVPIPSIEWVEKKAKELSGALHTEISDGKINCRISASIGASIAPKDGMDFEMLYKKADAALYHAKKHGKKGYALYKDI